MRAQISAPLGWAWSKVKHTGEFFTGWTPPTGNSESFEGENLWANISDLGPKELLDTRKRISDAAIRVSAIRQSPAGSVLFSFKLSIGQVSFAGKDMYTNEAIATFPPQGSLNSRWAYWAFPVFIPENAGENIYGAKLLNQELIRSADLLVPSNDDQERIANFLDDKTARIDALIAEKERLAKVLTELRAEAIDSAVLGTELLQRSKPLKGLEVLGTIPAGWAPSRMKFEIDYVTSGSRGWADFYTDEGALFVRIGNLTRDSLSLDLSDIQRVTLPDAAEGIRARVLPGDLLISITAYLGSIAVAPDDVDEAYVSQHVSLARPNHARALPEWLGYVVLSSVGRTFFELQAYGGTKVQLSLEDIRELPIPLPDMNVQAERLAHLKKRLVQISQLSAHAVEHIDRLREYRSSLISAAVTGQMDVGAFKEAA